MGRPSRKPFARALNTGANTLRNEARSSSAAPKTVNHFPGRCAPSQDRWRSRTPSSVAGNEQSSIRIALKVSGPLRRSLMATTASIRSYSNDGEKAQTDYFDRYQTKFHNDPQMGSDLLLWVAGEPDRLSAEALLDRQSRE